MLNYLFFPGGLYRSRILDALLGGPSSTGTGGMTGFSPLGLILGGGSSEAQEEKLSKELDGAVDGSAAGNNISNIVSRSNLMGTLSVDGSSTFNSVFGLLAGSGNFGGLLDNVVGGGDEGKSALDDSISKILSGGGSPLSKGIYEGLNAGGMPSGLDPDSTIGKIVGDAFKDTGQNGILGSSLSTLGASSAGGFHSSLLSSSAGKAEVLGGTGKVLQQLFAGFHTGK